MAPTDRTDDRRPADDRPAPVREPNPAPRPARDPSPWEPLFDRGLQRGLIALVAIIIAFVVVLIAIRAFQATGEQRAAAPDDSRVATMNDERDPGRFALPPRYREDERDPDIRGPARHRERGPRVNPASPGARNWQEWDHRVYRGAGGQLCTKNNYGHEKCCSLRGFTPRVVGQYPASQTYCDPPRS